MSNTPSPFKEEDTKTKVEAKATPAKKSAKAVRVFEDHGGTFRIDGPDVALEERGLSFLTVSDASAYAESQGYLVAKGAPAADGRDMAHQAKRDIIAAE